MSRPSWHVGTTTGALALAAGLLLVACTQRMDEQPRYDPLESSAFFPDGMSARPFPSDTVARGLLMDDPALFTGKVNGQDVTEFPFPVTREVLERGQQRFGIFCAPCHGDDGSGNGMVVQRGFPHPPSYHTDALRQAPVGHFFDVATNGLGPMPPYAQQVSVRDRWAIVAYIRALQLSQHATLDDVPPDARARLEQQP